MPGLPPDCPVSAALVALLDRQIHHADRARAALHLLDWIGCALIGTTDPVGRAIARLSGPPFALAGNGSAAAAGALGGLGSLFEMDDVHRAALLHPGPVVAPRSPPCRGAIRCGRSCADTRR